jgi:exopolysaccharide biosynthesis protein
MLGLGAGAAVLSCVAALGLSPGVSYAASTGSEGTSATPVTPYSWPTVLSERSTRPVTITKGISYSQTYYEMADGDAHAHVLNIDLRDSNVTLMPQLTTGVLASEGSTLSSVIARTGAVAGVNGDYFDRVGYIAEPAGDGQPTHMLIQDGRVVASGIPDDCGIVGYTTQDALVIGRESFSGTVTDGSASETLSAVNEVVWPDSTSQCNETVGRPGLVLETPEWGEQSELDEAAPIAILKDLGDSKYRVLSITASATESPALKTRESALIGYGASGTFVGGTLKAGQVISVADSVTPYTDDLEDAFGGGFLAVINGEVNPEIAGNNSDIEAATVIGVTKNGKHVIVGVFDGGEPGEEGIGYSEMAGWLLEHGAYEGIIMDNGGSSEMDARLPGDTGSSVLNTPSDGHERLLAECICFYSAERTAGAAASVTLNGGETLRALAGTTVDVPEKALDADDNPASGTATVTISPSRAATVTGTTTTPEGEKEAVLRIGKTAASATASITDGSSRSSIDLDVVTSLKSLTIKPAEPDVDNGDTQQLSLHATDSDGDSVTLPADAATWTVSDKLLGTTGTNGLFTAAKSGEGLDTVTAQAGGATTTAVVAVGLTSKLLDTMTDVSNWEAFGSGTGATASDSLSTTEIAEAGGTGALDLTYGLPAGPTIEEAGLYSPNGIKLSAVDGEDPAAIGLWIKVQGTTGIQGEPLQYGTLTLAMTGTDDHDDSIALYPAGVTAGGWEQVVGTLPSGTAFPFTLSTIDFIVVRPSEDLSGDIYIADLSALYPPAR